MSVPSEQPQNEGVAADATADRTAGVPPASAAGTDMPSSRPRASFRGAAVALAAALLLVAVLAASAPFWAAALPWAPPPGAPPPDPRIDRIEAAQQAAHQDLAGVRTTLQTVDQRLGALETRPAPVVGEIAELRQRLANLAATAGNLAPQVEAIDKSVQAQGSANADLAQRLAALHKAMHSQAVSDPTDTALVLVLLQIHGAIAVGRPFAAEYEALTALARSRPEIAGAAAPLAEPAKTGVAGRAVLAGRLRELAPAVIEAGVRAAAAADGAAAADWTEQVLSRLGGLVQVRRVDGGGQPQPEPTRQALVDNAVHALAGGDLAAAVAALDRQDGAAEVAGPWPRMAKQRLAVEAALHQIEVLLAARLGNAAAVPGTAR